MAQLDN